MDPVLTFAMAVFIALVFWLLVAIVVDVPELVVVLFWGCILVGVFLFAYAVLSPGSSTPAPKPTPTPVVYCIQSTPEANK